MVRINGVRCRVARDEIRDDVINRAYPQDMCATEIEEDKTLRNLFREGLRQRGNFYSNLDSILAKDKVNYISSDEGFDEYERGLDMCADADTVLFEKDVVFYENEFEAGLPESNVDLYSENLEEKGVRLSKRLKDFSSKGSIRVNDTQQLYKALVAVRKGEIKPHRYDLSVKLKSELVPWYSRNYKNKIEGVYNVASSDIKDYTHLEADLAYHLFGDMFKVTELKEDEIRKDGTSYVNRSLDGTAQTNNYNQNCSGVLKKNTPFITPDFVPLIIKPLTIRNAIFLNVSSVPSYK